jgi:hypothetical protein
VSFQAVPIERATGTAEQVDNVRAVEPMARRDEELAPDELLGRGDERGLTEQSRRSGVIQPLRPNGALTLGEVVDQIDFAVAD